MSDANKTFITFQSSFSIICNGCDCGQVSVDDRKVKGWGGGQCVRMLALQTRGPEFKSPVPVLKFGMAVCNCNPSTVGSRDRTVTEVCWMPASLVHDLMYI